MKKFAVVFVLMAGWIYALTAGGVPAAAAADQAPASAAATVPSAAAPVAAAPAVAAPSTTAPAQAGAPAASRPEGVSNLRDAGLQAAEAGEFEQGLAKYKAAARLQPDDRNLAQSVGLLENFLIGYHRWQGEQKVEFDQAARRVRLSMIAQAYLPALEKAGIEKKLREKMTEVLSARGHATYVDNLETAGPEKVAELKKKAAEAFAKGAAAMQDALALLKDDTSEYAKTFRGLAADFSAALNAYQAAWAGLDAATSKAVRTRTDTMRILEENLIDALDTLEGMTVEKPWSVGLFQARLAKLIVPEKDDMNRYDWYRDLVADIKTRGDQAVKDSRWYDALNVYASLNDLEPDNQDFKTQMKIARRHARVLGLYGNVPEGLKPNLPAGDPNLFPATKPAKKQENPDVIIPNSVEDMPDEDVRWKDVVEGVDAAMVQAVIAEIDKYYFSVVDYRKLARGALMSIKVLAETPQSASSFPSLGDAEKRNAFLKEVDAGLDNLDKRDRMEYSDLQFTFNSILKASERTVDIPIAVLAMEFCDGMMDELDKFSAMIWPHEQDDFRKQTMGNFQGVGISITKDPGEPLRVVAPLPGTPAYREGIKSGDLILAVDGKRTEPLTVDKLVRMITGPKGTKVVLTIKSPGGQPKDVTLIREEIHIRTVKGWRRSSGGNGDVWSFLLDGKNKIGYISLSQFTETSPADIGRALDELNKQGVQSLILDLRSDPGGLLESAKKIAGEFIASGRIVSIRGRQKNQQDFDATGDGRYLHGDLIVLVNELSASASEIVSGALGDWHRAIIVGQRTYGKGSVQNVIPIPDHPRAELKLTTAHYYLPSGRCLHRENGDKNWGVDPNAEVTMSPRQAKRWMELQRKTELLQDFDPDELSAELKTQYDDDMQLQAAALLLRLRQLRD